MAFQRYRHLWASHFCEKNAGEKITKKRRQLTGEDYKPYYWANTEFLKLCFTITVLGFELTKNTASELEKKVDKAYSYLSGPNSVSKEIRISKRIKNSARNTTI